MADYRGNPYELVYDNAIKENVPGKVNIKPVTYKLNGLDISANLYLPADYDENDDKVYAGITVAHPNGGTKEQVAGLYAQRLAEQGYVTIAADASYQGASHIRTYWVPEYVDDAVAKLSEFFGAKL